ncbi:MAG: GNAT family N-acetyltransferase [Nitrosopumilus sp.]
MIRNATALDKKSILKFCRDTFSWGDYIDQVWDFWLSEDHLFLFEKQFPVGICHAFYTEDQIWIEGIRIDPNFRRQKIASELVKHAESIGKKKNIQFSYMLIDTENTSSISMANSLDYDIFQTWNFYSLTPKRNSKYDVHFEKSLNRQLYSNYVKSWRWFPIDDTTLSTFYEKNKIIKSNIDGITSIAILTDSEHFEKTLIVTLFSGSQNTTLQIISFLQNYGIEKNYEKIQILTKEQLPLFDSLEHRISFHLMKKSLT